MAAHPDQATVQALLQGKRTSGDEGYAHLLSVNAKCAGDRANRDATAVHQTTERRWSILSCVFKQRCSEPADMNPQLMDVIGAR